MKKYEYDSKEGYGLLEAYGQDLKRRGASQNTIRTYRPAFLLSLPAGRYGKSQKIPGLSPAFLLSRHS